MFSKLSDITLPWNRAFLPLSIRRSWNSPTKPPETTPGGFYEATLEIQYDGDLDLKDNFYTLPITVVAPRPSGDETALLIFQETIPETAPEKSASFNLRYLSPTG